MSFRSLPTSECAKLARQLRQSTTHLGLKFLLTAANQRSARVVLENQVMFVFSVGKILCSFRCPSEKLSYDCDWQGAMLNFAARMSGYARYCPEMNA
jgi:hypothetical protein